MAGEGKQHMMRRGAFFIAAVFFCLFVTPRPSFAATCNLSATSPTDLDFGGLQKPSSTKTFAVNLSDVTSGTGTLLYGSPSHGKYNIKDNNACGGTTICITVTDTGGATGVTLGSWILNYNGASITNGQCGLANPATTPLLIGATATFTSGVSIGAQSPTFNIHVVENGNTEDISETALIAFDIPLSINTVSNINFGTVKAGQAGTYVMSPAGDITPSVGGVLEGGTTAAGQLTIIGSTTQAITISDDNYINNNGVTISNAKGSYAGGTAKALPFNAAAPGAGTTLMLGVKVHADGTQASGATATPTFDVTVVYQ